MTALAAARDTAESAVVETISPLYFPIAAATTIWAGSLVATDASGNAVPASASTALKCWGRAEKTVANTVAAGYGSAGQLSIEVKPGVFCFANGSGADAITAAHVGMICYASDDQTVNLTDGAGLRPAVGKIYGLQGTQVKVGVGEPSLYDAADNLAAPVVIKTARARNVINGNVADLTAYTVAANAAVNDNVLNVANDIVLVVAQTTAAQNGLYKVGTVGGGTAPLTRIAPMPAGYVFVADEFEIAVGEGAVFAHSKWFNSAGGTIATNTPAFMPETVTISQALTAGTATVASIPVLSATKTFIGLTRRIANTSTATTGGYCTTVGGANGVTAGALGTASIVIEACVAAGTINNADISTLEVSVHNR